MLLPGSCLTTFAYESFDRNFSGSFFESYSYTQTVQVKDAAILDGSVIAVRTLVNEKEIFLCSDAREKDAPLSFILTWKECGIAPDIRKFRGTINLQGLLIFPGAGKTIHLESNDTYGSSFSIPSGAYNQTLDPVRAGIEGECMDETAGVRLCSNILYIQDKTGNISVLKIEDYGRVLRPLNRNPASLPENLKPLAIGQYPSRPIAGRILYHPTPEGALQELVFFQESGDNFSMPVSIELETWRGQMSGRRPHCGNMIGSAGYGALLPFAVVGDVLLSPVYLFLLIYCKLGNCFSWYS